MHKMHSHLDAIKVEVRITADFLEHFENFPQIFKVSDKLTGIDIFTQPLNFKLKFKMRLILIGANVATQLFYLNNYNINPKKCSPQNPKK